MFQPEGRSGSPAVSKYLLERHRQLRGGLGQRADLVGLYLGLQIRKRDDPRPDLGARSRSAARRLLFDDAEAVAHGLQKLKEGHGQANLLNSSMRSSSSSGGMSRNRGGRNRTSVHSLTATRSMYSSLRVWALGRTSCNTSARISLMGGGVPARAHACAGRAPGCPRSRCRRARRSPGGPAGRPPPAGP